MRLLSGMPKLWKRAAAPPTINRWGMRMMTYEINRFREAFYVLYEGPMDGTKIVDVERDLNYNENVLRYLFVRE